MPLIFLITLTYRKVGDGYQEDTSGIITYIWKINPPPQSVVQSEKQKDILIIVNFHINWLLLTDVKHLPSLKAADQKFGVLVATNSKISRMLYCCYNKYSFTGNQCRGHSNHYLHYRPFTVWRYYLCQLDLTE